MSERADVKLDAAVEQIRDLPVCLSVESTALADAHGRVLARAVHAERDHPEVPLSLVDGYAVPQTAAEKAGMRLTGETLAGDESTGDLQMGEAVRVTAGAVVPRGAAAVVREEDCAVEDEMIHLRAACALRGQNIQRKGSEVRAGETLVEAGTVLSAEELALLAVADVGEVRVFRCPRVGILSTGTEIVEVGKRTGPQQKTNSNFFWLNSRLCSDGAAPVPLGLASDDVGSLSEALVRRDDLDIVLTTGGLGRGRADLMRDVWDRVIPDHLIYSVAVRPVRKFMLGRVDETYCISLPGAPAAVRSLYKLLVVPLLARMQGRRDLRFNMRHAVLTEMVHSSYRDSTALVEGYLQPRKGRLTFSVYPGTPGGERTMSGEDTAHLIIPPGEETIDDGQLGTVFL